MAGQLEDQADVKCWTSFNQLETYVAGCQLAPYSTHLKSQVVIDLIDQIWKIASTGLMNGDVVTGDEFDQTVKACFQWDNIKFVSYSVRFGDHELIIPFQDIDNYLGTVEPIRLIQILAQSVEQQDPSRQVLDVSAIESAVQLAAILSTVVLKEANRIGIVNHHATIEDEDILAVGHQLAKHTGLEPFDLSQLKKPPSSATENPHHVYEDMLANIQNKIHALDAFNTTYSQEILDEKFTASLSKHESQWARREVDPEASEIYKQHVLVVLANCFTQIAESDTRKAIF